MSKLIKNTSFYTFGNILPKAAKFILLPIYTRYLTPEEYGVVNSMNVLLAILAIFFTMAIERSIYRLYFDYKTEEEKKNYLGSVFITVFLNAIIVLVIIFLSNSLIAKIYSSIPFNPYYLYIIGTGFLSVFGIIPKIYFQVEQKAGKFILISLAEFFVSTAFMIYFVVFAGQGASGMLLASLAKTVFFIPLYIYILFKVVNFTFKFEIMKESFIFSLPLVPMILSAWILNLSDRVFIEHFSSLKEVGIYSLAYKLPQALLIFSSAFNKAYDPLFYKTANDLNQIEAKAMLFKYNKIFSIVLIIGALTICLFAQEFILLLDAKYESAINLVPILMIGVLFAQVGGIFNRSFYQMKRTKLIMVLSFGVATLNVGLNWLFIPKYGSFGAAYATAISFISFFIIKYYFSGKCYFIPVAWKELGVYLLISVSAVSLFYFINISIMFSILLKIVIILCISTAILYKYKGHILNLVFKNK